MDSTTKTTSRGVGAILLLVGIAFVGMGAYVLMQSLSLGSSSDAMTILGVVCLFGLGGWTGWKGVNLIANRPRVESAAMVEPPSFFPPGSKFLAHTGPRPQDFKQGVEILNDDTTPMEFVVNSLQQHVGMDYTEALKVMLFVHNKGGILIPMPTQEEAERVTSAMMADAALQNHALKCRLVKFTDPPPA